MTQKIHMLENSEIIQCIQSSSFIGASLGEPSQNSNRLLTNSKITRLIGFFDVDIWAGSVRSILYPVCLLWKFPHKTLQTFQFVSLVRSVRKPYSFIACNVDKQCNLDSVVDEGVN